MDVKSSPSWLERRALPLFFLGVCGVVDPEGSGWVSPAPKRDRRLPSFRGLFSVPWEVVALGAVGSAVDGSGGFLRRL